MRQMSTRAAIWTCACLAAMAAFATTGWARGEAKGTLTYRSKTAQAVVAVKHAHLFKGPDMVSRKVIRRLVLSVADVGGVLSSCQSMSCSDAGIGEGLTIDFDAGPRLYYWFVAKGQLIQHTGAANSSAVKLTTDTATRLAGTIDIDDRDVGGPLIQVEFDASVIKEVKK